MTLVQPSPPPYPAGLPTARSASGSVSSSASLIRGRRPSGTLNDSGANATARIGEIAGSTAAVCCCLPCGIVGLVVCAAVKLPAGLCKKACFKKRRRRVREMKKKALWGPRVGSSFDDNDMECVMAREEWGIPTTEPSPEEAAMETEMWARFYETGFWRSPSQREDLSNKQI